LPARAQTSTSAIVTAARTLLEERGPDALTMRDVATAVGVQAPSLYKRVRNRSDLIRLVLDDVMQELMTAQTAAATTGDPATDLRAILNGYRTFAHANPAAYALLYAPPTAPGEPDRSQRLSATLLHLVTELSGPADALPAARTLVAWANGFIAMELADSFHLGGDLPTAWTYGLTHILTAITPPHEAA
jgi:AcrR family transcriptional regulator